MYKNSMVRMRENFGSLEEKEHSGSIEGKWDEVKDHKTYVRRKGALSLGPYSLKPQNEKQPSRNLTCQDL